MSNADRHIMDNLSDDITKDIINRFTYHRPKGGQVEYYETIREEGKSLAFTFLDLCPESRELSLAITKLEEAVMWANAAIARHNA